MALGDDSLFLWKRKPDYGKFVDECKALHNLDMSVSRSSVWGEFLKLIFYIRKNGTVGMCPDIVRMRYKYEVTNGDASVNVDSMNTRAISYAMLLGNLPGLE